MSALKFTLFRPFKNIIMNLVVQKYRFGKERHIKQINDIWEWQKKMVESHHSMEKGHVRKESGITTKGRSEKEESILLLDNDKLKTMLWSIKY